MKQVLEYIIFGIVIFFGARYMMNEIQILKNQNIALQESYDNIKQEFKDYQILIDKYTKEHSRVESENGKRWEALNEIIKNNQDFFDKPLPSGIDELLK